MLKRAFFLLTIFFFLSLVFPFSASAQQEFFIDVNVEYRIRETGNTLVTHNITLENAFSKLYATSYTLNLSNIDPQNPRALEGGEPLELEVFEQQGTTTLKVNFDEPVVGKGEKRTFSISFEEDSFAERTGEVWEISIPRLSTPESFRNYNLKLLTPTTFGQVAYISPEPISRTTQDGFLVYSFNKNAIAKSGISAGFGQFQVFSFTLNYHLENPLNKRASVEIALPPDTAFQKVYYESLDPKPSDVVIDEDGNWLAKYILDPRQRVDVSASGAVQIFSQPRGFSPPSSETLQGNLQATEFWQVNDPQIQSLARQLKTPQAIYNYVTNNLSYDYDRVRPNVTRLGAKGALISPNSAICMEFTDLFIAIARAADIPAREINGYAYTENPEIQPLSLVADVLHAWPEYWDEEKKVWVPVDPTWGSTTGGVDFFNKLDLRHFTFVIHGQDATSPFPPGSYKLGPNPQKDVFVSFGQLPQQRVSKPEILAETSTPLPFMSSTLEINIKNPGPVALYDLNPQVYFEDKVVKTSHINSLPPFSTTTMKVKVPFSFLGADTPDKVTVMVADSRVEVPTFKTQVIIYNLLALFLAITLLVSIVFIRYKKIEIKNLPTRLKGLLKRQKDVEKTKEGKNNQGQPQENS